MSKIEFIHFKGCPNIDATRTNLMKALSEAKLPAKWTEWDRNDENAPSYVKNYGSPTILVDGKDVAGSSGESESDSECCRVYQTSDGVVGTPSVDLILQALNQGSSISGSRSLKSGGLLAAIPAVAIAVLPKLTCAACWPAYAAIMSSLGVGFFNYTDYLLPIMVVAVAVSLGLMFYKNKVRRGLTPFYLGLVGSLLMLVGKFSLGMDWVSYVGAAVLVGASIWNSIPVKSKTGVDCPACET